MRCCINHPDRPLTGKQRLCDECRREHRRLSNQKNYADYRSDEMPPKKDLERLAELKYDIRSVAQRYQVTLSTVKYWYRFYDIALYVKPTKSRIAKTSFVDFFKKYRDVQHSGGTITADDLLYTAMPKRSTLGLI